MNDGKFSVHRMRARFVYLSALVFISPVAVLANNADLQTIYEKAFGQKQQHLPSELITTLRVGQQEVGDLKVFTDQKNITHVDSQQFLTLLKTQLIAKAYQAINDHAKQYPQRFPLIDLKEWSISSRYNPNSLSLDLRLPDSIRLPKSLSLKRKRQTIYNDDELNTAETFSGYTNFSAKITHDHHSGENTQRVQAKSVLNADNLVLENQITWRNQENNYNDEAFNRDYTRLSVDDPDSEHRYQLGDINTLGINLQNGVALGGVSIRKYNNMNPYRQSGDQANKAVGNAQTFTITETSRVKIFINDRLQTIRQLDEGLYSLSDLQLSAGINTVKLEIMSTSGNGELEEKTFTLNYDQQLLANNESEYGIDFGLPRYRKQGRYAYDADNPIASAYYQQGLADQMTVGVSGLSDGEQHQVGINATKSGKLGDLKATVSVTDNDNNRDFGSKIEYRYRANKDLPNLFLSSEYYGKDFSSLRYQTTENRLAGYEQQTQHRLHAQISQQFDNQLQVSMSGQYATKHDAEDAQKSANLSLRKQFDGGKSASINMRYQNGHYEDKSAQVHLHIPFIDDKQQKGRYKTFDTRYDTLDESIISRFTLSPKGNLGKDSLATSVTHHHYKNSDSVSATLSYRDPRFESTVSHQVSKRQGEDDYQHRSQVKFNTAVAFAGDAVALSRPIQDSFAIVKAPDNQHLSAEKRQAIAVAKGDMSFRREQGNDLPDYYHGVIGKQGTPAVIALSDYHQTHINVDSTALPLGSDPDATEFKVRPNYHQGYQLQAGGELGVIIDAVLKDEKGDVLPLKGGELVAVASTKNKSKKSKAQSFFTNRAGRLRLSLPVGRYKLELYDYPDLAETWIDVPNKKGEQYDLGIVQIPVNQT